MSSPRRPRPQQYSSWNSSSGIATGLRFWTSGVSAERRQQRVLSSPRRPRPQQYSSLNSPSLRAVVSRTVTSLGAAVAKLASRATTAAMLVICMMAVIMM
ncbi:hypothetical protein Micbo1qcDRAFT_161601 [Microdochium bolleyi]|uniref:Uncharacterized protein n=1 Tax=Microdochium bolleyi TaxID=196109 RepID=A0A136J8W2_9PEZI|nr:hypothetical protein Micbo1qcDRAFT_161601 [Microdochium bolleyi]